MLKVVEIFAGIGAQKQALKNIKIDHSVEATVEWEIGAMLAYQIMHHGYRISPEIKKMTKLQLVNKLREYTLSSDGKKPISNRSLAQMPIEKLMLLMEVLCNDERRHFTDITKIKGRDLSSEIDLLTYSFPCQDLSLGAVFHNGGNNGIKKNGGTRSGLLWEVERILDERSRAKMNLPNFLLMENVMQVFSKKHKQNFEQWIKKLEKLGYYNHFSYEDENKQWILDASNFGLPQTRKRAFMLSVKVDRDDELKSLIDRYLTIENNLTRPKVRKMRSIEKFIFLDKYENEQIKVHPNYTRSRQKIHGVIIERNKNYNSVGNPILVYYNKETNKSIFSGKIARTITTKQDRDPNAGLIETVWGANNRRPYRYLTQRECFGLMGFPKSSFESIVKAKIKGLEGEKLYKLAGNSICVPVLEEIFMAVEYIRKEILNEK